MKKKIDIIVLTGFLGSGKTTLLNHILALRELESQTKVLIINEFSSLGVDGARVKSATARKYEINSGSLFCACTKVSLLKVLAEIAESIAPDLVIIEATGVGEPRDLLSIIDESPALAGLYRIRSTICLVDALNFTKVAPFLSAARSQVVFADGIVINKIDLVTGSEQSNLKAVLEGMNPSASLAAVTNGKIDFAWLDGLDHCDRGAFAGEIGRPADIFSVSFQTDQIVRRDKFMEVLKSLQHNLLRLKGNIDFGSERVYGELVGDDFHEESAIDLKGKSTSFSVIAWNLSKITLQEKFSATWA